MNPLKKYYYLIRQLGIGRLSLNLIYRFFSFFNIWKILTPVKPYPMLDLSFNRSINIPFISPEQINQFLTEKEKDGLINSANRISNNEIKIFGYLTLPLTLNYGTSYEHWSKFDKGQFAGQDIKFIWEPARFGWAVILARAYLLTHNEIYCEKFWSIFESFSAENPPNSGPHWASGQEIAIRIFVFSLVCKIFSGSPHSSASRQRLLLNVIAAHTDRIPKTIFYAQSQDNNHLLVEAAGLITAGLFLENHTSSKKWLNTGWKLFHSAIQNQIDPDGTYTQHSTNYHRLMLQTALWIFSISQDKGLTFPEKSLSKLKAATMWLSDLVDPVSGHCPNLGNNDGAYLLPLTCLDYYDFRPVVQTAFLAFFGFPFFSNDTSLDEMPAWFGFLDQVVSDPVSQTETSSGLLKISGDHIWAYLRAAKFSLRAAHADQLHIDMWAYGHNILLDAGTYSYNAPAPWDNRLSSTAIHNTIQVNDHDQMFRAGKYLWLKLAQARVLLNSPGEIMAEHDGYQSEGWLHRRHVKFESANDLVVTDHLFKFHQQKKDASIAIHWLFPDWPFSFTDTVLTLEAPFGKVVISSILSSPETGYISPEYELTRGGESIDCLKSPLPQDGWYSPAYGVKFPALSFRIKFHYDADITFQTHFLFINH